MKHLFTCLLMGWCIVQLYGQSTTLTPNVFTPPSLSYDAIMALPPPPQGSAVFDVTNKVLRLYIGTKWVSVVVNDQETLPSGTTAWRAGGESIWGDVGKDIAVDGAGNVYVTGYFYGTATFDTTTFAYNSAIQHMFIAKYTNSGRIQWIKAVRDAFSEGITVDAVGNVYVTGRFGGTVTFGTTSLTVTGIYDVFVAKYNNAGTLQWVQKAGGIKDDRGQDVAVDASGNVYITGYFEDAITFGNTNLTSAGYIDMFVAKYNNAGTLQWVRKAGGAGGFGDQGNAIAVDAGSNVYVVGAYDASSGPAVFDTVSVTGSIGAYVAKYSAGGAVQWVKKTGGFGNIADITADANGNIYVASGAGIQLSKYNSSGVLQWERQPSSTGSNAGGITGVALDVAGNIYVAGFFSDPTTFNATTIVSAGDRDVFVAKYTGAGTVQWVKQAGGPTYDYCTGIAVTPNGAGYATGNFSGTATFGASVLTSAGAWDIFVMRIVE